MSSSPPSDWVADYDRHENERILAKFPDALEALVAAQATLEIACIYFFIAEEDRDEDFEAEVEARLHYAMDAIEPVLKEFGITVPIGAETK